MPFFFCISIFVHEIYINKKQLFKKFLDNEGSVVKEGVVLDAKLRDTSHRKPNESDTTFIAEKKSKKLKSKTVASADTSATKKRRAYISSDEETEGP